MRPHVDGRLVVWCVWPVQSKRHVLYSGTTPGKTERDKVALLQRAQLLLTFRHDDDSAFGFLRAQCQKQLYKQQGNLETLPDEKLLENFGSKAICPPSSNKWPWSEISKVLDCGFGVFWVHKNLLGVTVFIGLNCRGCFKKGRDCPAHCVSDYCWSLFGNCGSKMTNIVYFM